MLSCFSYQLPDDVFDPSESKPVKVEKKKKSSSKSATKAASVKRDVAAAGLEVRPPLHSKLGRTTCTLLIEINMLCGAMYRARLVH